MIGFRRGAGLIFACGWMGLGAALAGAAPVAVEGTQPGGLAGGTPPADVASKCSSCHAGGSDQDGKTFRPWDTWSGTMMANATRDPLFLAALTVSEQDVPGSGAYCLRCHTPKGFVKGHATGTGAALDADDNQGVECEACHRSVDGSKAQPAVDHDGATIAALAALDARAPYLGNARLVWDPRDVRHGPRADADSPAHAAAANSFTSSAALCGQCHELWSPLRNLLDAAGKDTGYPFPLDTTTTEWASSEYALPGTTKSCIDCHMTTARGDSLALSTYPSAMRRANPRMHLFVGGNEWGLDAVQMAFPELGAERSAAFEAAREATRAMLASAVKVEVLPAGAVQAGGSEVTVTVRVTNLAGHKFPSGYADGRRAFLQVELQDDKGQTLGLLGRYDATAARLDPTAELRVWEAVHAEHLAGGGHIEWHIAKNDTVVKDTRIPPAGFHPTSAAAIAMTAAVGADFGPLDAIRNHDDVPVRFQSLSPLPAGSLQITARVFYQSTTREFVEALAAANTTDDRGVRLREIWEKTGRAAPRLIATASSALPVAAPADGGRDAAGDGAGNDAGAGTPADAGCGCGIAGEARGGWAAGALALLLVGWQRRRSRKSPRP